MAIIKEGRILTEGPPATLSASAGRYRVAWRDENGVAQEREEEDPTALLHQLTSAALARGSGIEEISVTRPTLEDVYLELTADEVDEVV